MQTPGCTCQISLILRPASNRYFSQLQNSGIRTRRTGEKEPTFGRHPLLQLPLESGQIPPCPRVCAIAHPITRSYVGNDFRFPTRRAVGERQLWTLCHGPWTNDQCRHLLEPMNSRATFACQSRSIPRTAIAPLANCWTMPVVYKPPPRKNAKKRYRHAGS